MVAKFEPLPAGSSRKPPHPAVSEFAQGIDGVKPGDAVVAMANRIVQVAIMRTADSEISVDVDGALSFVSAAERWPSGSGGTEPGRLHRRQ